MSPQTKSALAQIGRGIGLGIIAALAAAIGSISAPKIVEPHNQHDYALRSELHDYAKRSEVASREDVMVIRDDIRELRRMLLNTGGRQ